MSKLRVKDFFNNEFKQYSQNKNYQSIASCVDGLKPTARKAIHTVLKNNINSWTKVEVLANRTAGETEYLGGSSNISGVIVNVARKYTTSNNITYFETNGNFGQRLNNKPGEPRYIKIRKSKEVDKYIKKEDNPILIEQIFEETIIEPRFFLPTLPMILINRNEGMGSGHAQDILPRNPIEIKEILIKKIKGKHKCELLPYWDGFKGKVQQGEASNKFITEGLYEVNKRVITITELPVGYQLLKYTKILDDLLDKKIIRRYIDESDTKKDIFSFKVTVPMDFDMSHDNIISKLKLSTKFSENYTCIDENNAIKLFDNIDEIMDHYIKVKLEFTQKRKDYILSKFKSDLDTIENKIKFIQCVIDGKIIVNNTKKQDIVKQIADNDISKLNGSYDYLLNMAIYTLSKERLEDLLKSANKLKTEYTTTEKKTIQSIWLEEIRQVK